VGRGRAVELGVGVIGSVVGEGVGDMAGVVFEEASLSV